MRGRFNRSRGGSVSFFAFQDVITATTGFLIVITIFLALDVHEVVGTGAPAATAPAPAELTEKLGKIVEQIVALKEKVGGKAAPEEDAHTLRRVIEELKQSIARLSLAGGPAEMPAEESALGRELRIEKQKLITLLEELEKQAPNASRDAKEADARVAELEARVKELQSRLQKAREQQNVIHFIPEKTGTSKEPVVLVVEHSGFTLLTLDGKKTPGVKSFADLTKALQTFAPATSYVVLYFKPSGALLFDDATRHVRKLGYEIGYDILPEAAEVSLGPVKS